MLDLRRPFIIVFVPVVEMLIFVILLFALFAAFLAVSHIHAGPVPLFGHLGRVR